MVDNFAQSLSALDALVPYYGQHRRQGVFSEVVVALYLLP